MAITPDIAGIYKVTWSSFDWMGETIRKTTRLNQEAPGEIVTLLEYFDELTAVGHSSVRANIEAIVDSFDDTAEVGVHGKVVEQIVLVFTRNHPANANKLITTSFSIPGPLESIWDASAKQLIYTTPFPTSTGAVVSNPDRLGYIIGWLEDNLIFEDTLNQVITVGGWSFSAQRTAFITNARIYDGVQGT